MQGLPDECREPLVAQPLVQSLEQLWLDVWHGNQHTKVRLGGLVHTSALEMGLKLGPSFSSSSETRFYFGNPWRG